MVKKLFVVINRENDFFAVFKKINISIRYVIKQEKTNYI